jgi:hypothetical protein
MCSDISLSLSLEMIFVLKRLAVGELGCRRTGILLLQDENQYRFHLCALALSGIQFSLAQSQNTKQLFIVIAARSLDLYIHDEAFIFIYIFASAPAFFFIPALMQRGKRMHRSR